MVKLESAHYWAPIAELEDRISAACQKAGYGDPDELRRELERQVDDIADAYDIDYVVVDTIKESLAPGILIAGDNPRLSEDDDAIETLIEDFETEFFKELKTSFGCGL